MLHKFKWLVVSFVMMTFIFSGVLAPNTADAAKKSREELEKAKKEGDLSVKEAQKFRDAFGKEADEANIEVFDNTGAKPAASGNSTYGVAGFDYLTGVGKVASDPSMINEKTFKIKSQNKSPLEGLMKKRFKHSWTGQYNDTQSGWGEKSGVTEAWFRKHDSGSKLGGDYN
ncbi:hypothetical protein MNBD_BACTEROID07-1039, partial [hydrothermal vent metagenome]